MEAISIPNKTLRYLPYRPSPYEHAVLSAHVYLDGVRPGATIQLKDNTTGIIHMLPDWEVVETIKKEGESSILSRIIGKGDYIGRVYRNRKKHQLVLAHRGFKLSNPDTLRTAFTSVIGNVIHKGQERLMPAIIAIFNDKIRAAEKETGQQHTASFTGHSLGGWLAQLCTFLIYDEEKGPPKAIIPSVTFDTPGAAPMIEKMANRTQTDIQTALDITNYLSSPNRINCCNAQLGSLYRVVYSDRFSAGPKYTPNSHKMDNFLQAFDPKTGDAFCAEEIKRWPTLSGVGIHTITKHLAEGEVTNALSLFRHFPTKYVKARVLGSDKGAYGTFFEFAKKENNYNPSEETIKSGSKEAFDLKFKACYDTIPFQANRIHRRHVSWEAETFLRCRAHPNVKEALATTRLAEHLYIWQSDSQQYLYLDEKAASKDIRFALDELIGILPPPPVIRQLEREIQQSKNDPCKTFNHVLPPVAYFVGREEERQKLDTLFDSKEHLIVAPPITGPPGIGKTQFVRKYITERQSQDYNAIIQLEAQNPTTLRQSYLDLAATLGCPIGEIKDPKKTLNYVKKKLSTKRCLYLFENAPNSKDIRPYYEGLQGHVLITSRNSSVNDWDKVPWELSTFDKSNLLTLATNLGHNTQDPDLQKLISFIPPYPLAAAQLLTLLRDYTPKYFLKELQKDKALMTLLGKEPKSVVTYKKSLQHMLHMTVEKLKQETEGEKALALLQKIVYLNPNAIPLDFILTFEQERGEDPFAALVALEKASLIQRNRDSEPPQLHIHALAQQMLREAYPSDPTELVARFIAYNKGYMKENKRSRLHWAIFLPHGEALLAHLPQHAIQQRERCITN